MTEFSIIGRSWPRVDARRKVTGEARFSADIQLPNALHGKILRSPYPHACIRGMDTRRAERMPGVKAVITARDAAPVKLGLMKRDQYVLAVDRVRYIGEPVAAVAAVDEDTALEALDLIRVDYEPLPAVFDPEEALQPSAPLVHDGGNLAHRLAITRGDGEKGFQEAALVLEDRFDTSYVHQAFMEPLACLASTDASDGLTIWTSLKATFRLKDLVGRFVGLAPGNIRVILTEIGGDFGGKGLNRFTFVCIGSLLAVKAGKPVMMANTREEEFMASAIRNRSVIEMKIGFRKDGRIAAKATHVVVDSGAYALNGPLILSVTSKRHDCLYRMTHLQTEASLVYTNNCPIGQFRGFGHPEGTWAMESMLSRAADELGMDPLELRRMNAVQRGDTNVHGWVLRSCGLEECMERAAGAARWQEKRKARGPYEGTGVSCMTHVCGQSGKGFSGSRAWVKIDEGGKATVISGEGDTGGGAQTLFAMIAAEELGMPLEDVRVLPVDTDVSPYCTGLSADKGTTEGGNAVKLAATAARDKLFVVAADRLEASPTDLVSQKGRIFVRGYPEKSLSIAEVASQCWFGQNGQAVLGQGDYDPPCEGEDPLTGYGDRSPAYSFGTQIVDVETDPQTGATRVGKVVTAVDLGRAIHPRGAEGQIEGAFLQGMSSALMEELVRKDGLTLNPHFVSCRVPTAMDQPPMENILVETVDPIGPFGAKGVGEPAHVPPAAALASAIAHATSVRVRSLPITPERLLSELEEIHRKAP